MTNYLRVSDVQVYKRTFELSNIVWEIVMRWDWFAKRAIGTQFAEAVDSISANIAEGFGRYHKNDKIKFYHYALGSRAEAEDWTRKAFARGLITPQQHKDFLFTLDRSRPEIWALINLTKEKLAI